MATHRVTNVRVTFAHPLRQVTFSNVNLPVNQEVELRLGTVAGPRLSRMSLLAYLSYYCELT